MNCLNHFAYQDAIFLSERLHAESNRALPARPHSPPLILFSLFLVQSEESLYLLALSHFRSGARSLRAYHLLRERHLKSPKAKYLLARCCLDLAKYSEAEAVLTNDLFANPVANHASAHASQQQQASPMPMSSKQKLYDEVLREYGSEFSSYVLQILASVYS